MTTISKSGEKKEGPGHIDKVSKRAWDICRDNPGEAIKLARTVLNNSSKSGYKLGVARAHHIIGAGKGWLSKFKEAEAEVNLAIESFAELREFADLGLSYYSMGVINYYKGDFDKSRLYFGLSYETYVASNDQEGKTRALNGLGSIHTELENFSKAWEYFDRGMALADRTGNEIIKSQIADGMATLSRKEGNYNKAIEYYNLAFTISKKLKNRHSQATSLEGLGESCLELGDYERARESFENSLALRREAGFKIGEAECMISLGYLYMKQGDVKLAEKTLRESLSLSRIAEGKAIELQALKHLTHLYKKSGKWKQFATAIEEFYNLKQELSSEATLKQQNLKLEKAFENTKVLSEIGQEIISSLELEKILFTIYNKVNQLMDASVFGIGIYHEEEKKIEYKLAIERGKKYKPYIRDSTDKSQLAVWCIDNKKHVFINDVVTEQEKYTGKYVELESVYLEDGSESMESEQSIIYVPIISGNEVLGLITVQSFEKNAYSEHHLDILKNIAIYASIALINANVYQSMEDKIELSREIKEQHARLEKAYENNKILSEIAKDITSSLSVPDVINKVYKNINSLMDASVFAIGVYKDDTGIIEFEGTMEKGKKLPSYKNDIKDTRRPAVICFSERKEIIINDRIKDYTRVLGQVPAPAVGEAPESIIYLPLISKKKSIGVITVQSFEKNAYSEYHIDILKNLAAYIPIALENALLYGEMEENVRRRTAEIERSYSNTKLLAEIGQDIVSARSIESITETVYKKVNSLMDASGLAIGIHNEAENRLDFLCDMEKGEKLPFNSESLDEMRLSVWCFKNQKEVVINDFQEEFKNYFKGIVAPKPSVGDEPESIIYLPLTLKKKKIGVFTVQSFNKNAYSTYHIDIVRNLSVSICTAIENAMLYGSLEEKVRERTEELMKEKEKAEFEREEAKFQRRRAEQSERFKQQFLANMSHEIRTPMNAIMGMTNLILEKDPRKEHLGYLNTIKESSESLLVIINDILDLSKIEAGKMELEQVDFSLEEVINLVEKTLSHRADEKGLILSLAYDDQIPRVLVGDGVRLQQVLMNITGNAIKFTEKGGVSLSVNIEGGAVVNNQAKIRFEIRDTGIGMTREQQNRVFENFSQAASDTTRKYGGTGLGLSISSKFVELFGSSIKLESELGEGSTFHFTIIFKVSENQHTLSKEMDISGSMLSELAGIKILLAEDNEYNRIVATETLELKIPGVKLTCAVNGEEAIKLAEAGAGDIDVVLMDVQMPVMDGFDATRAIRGHRNKTVNRLPIIALTASVIRADIQRCFDAGMNGYIPKPFKTSELIKAIYQAVKTGGLQDNITKYIKRDEAGISTEKITHLSYLHDFTEGDGKRMKKYIDLYLDSARSNASKLKSFLRDNELEALKVLVHSMKPHFDFMGMKDTRQLAEFIEQLLMEKKNLDIVPEKLTELIAAVDRSIDELADYRP